MTSSETMLPDLIDMAFGMISRSTLLDHLPIQVFAQKMNKWEFSRTIMLIPPEDTV